MAAALMGDSQQAERVTFRVLGMLEVLVRGRPVELSGAKPRALLTMLVLHPNQVISPDRLMEGLWGDRPPASAVNTLQGYVSQLRKSLRPATPTGGDQLIETRPPGYRLTIHPDAVDALRFERLLTEGRALLAAGEPGQAASLLEKALGMWRGPALADFSLEEFAQADIARLSELRVQALEEQLEAQLALGRHAESVGALRGLVDEHPLRERLWGQLIVALYRCGRQGEALRAFTQLRQRLREELGIDPSPALRALEEAVLLQQAGLDWSPPTTVQARPAQPPHNLPAPRSSFIGRDDELNQLEKSLEAARLVTVVGPGGVGKTRLGLEVARRLLGDHADGAWLVELGPIREPALVPRAMAQALGVVEESGRALVDTLARALIGKRLLVVLDNCEHLVCAAAALVDALLGAVAGLRVLATSREPLRVDGETVWRISTLDVPATDDLGPEALMGFDGPRLFVERAASSGGFVLGADNAAAVGQLCRRLDGIPLAIELAAARTPALGPAQMLGRLDDRFKVLRGGARVLARHQTLAAAIDWSHDMLGEPERILFRRLSVFAGGFTLEAAEAVCASDDLARSDVLESLVGLVDRSIVMTKESGGDMRYDLLETLRAYGAERLAEAGEEEMTQARHLGWAVQFAETYAESVRGAAVETWVGRMRAEHDNVERAFSHSLVYDTESALRLVAAVGLFWGGRGLLQEGRKWADAALAAAADPPAALQARALSRAGALASMQGDPSGWPKMERAAAALRGLGDKRFLAELAGFMAPEAMRKGDLGLARMICDEALAAARDVQIPHHVAWVLALIGQISQASGDFDDARRRMDEAIAILLGLGERRAVAQWTACLGQVALDVGDYATAQRLGDESLATQRELDDKRMMSRSLALLGHVSYLQGRLERAGDLYEEQRAVAQEAGLGAVAVDAQFGLGLVALRRGDLERARPLLLAAVLASVASEPISLPSRIEALGALVAREGQPTVALELFAAADFRRRSMRTPLAPARRALWEADIAASRAAITSGVFWSAWAQGESLTLEQIAALARVDFGDPRCTVSALG